MSGISPLPPRYRPLTTGTIERGPLRSSTRPPQRRIGQAGHESGHVHEIGLTTADDAILNRASEVGDGIVTADADFGTLLALGGYARPPVVLLRSSDQLPPDDQADLVLNSLEGVPDAFEHGAVATVTPGRVWIRSLPVEES